MERNLNLSTSAVFFSATKGLIFMGHCRTHVICTCLNASNYLKAFFSRVENKGNLSIESLKHICFVILWQALYCASLDLRPSTDTCLRLRLLGPVSERLLLFSVPSLGLWLYKAAVHVGVASDHSRARLLGIRGVLRFEVSGFIHTFMLCTIL